MSKTMQGLALYGNQIAEVKAFPRPEPAAGEVRIQVMSAGICGSDLHFYNDTPEGLGPRRGVVIGHEPAGVVEAVGDGVTHPSIGDRVAVNHTLGCGHCEYCMAGETVLCADMIGMAQDGRGADGEYVVMPARNCHVLPDGLSFADGSFISCTGATAFGAMSKLAPRGGDTVAVFGLGPVGLSMALVARAMGARTVGVDVISDRIAFAKDIGVDAVVDGTEAVQAIRRMTAGGATHSVETSGSAAGQRNAVLCLRPKGRAVYVGLSERGPSISPEDFLHEEKVLMGSKVLSSPNVERMIRFMLDTGLRFDPLVTKTIPLRDGPAAFAEFNRGAVGKFVLKP